MIEILQDWQKTIQKCEYEIKRFRDFFNTVECDIVDSFELLMEKYTIEVAEKIGCTHSCLYWFWLDNEMGKLKLKAGVDDKMKRIKNLDDLVWLINLQKESDK